ncbi:MAG: 16S rRNA (guanine(966)-N(2))-methyltransferase RsmD [Pseudomonadota bacterium]
MARRQKETRRPPNSLRIIAGRWRSRKIDFAPSSEIRPTSDRIRETLFNWLGTRVPGSQCLDLFAGSGVLSIEALSRGAERVTVVDHDPLTIAHIRTTLTHLDGIADAALINSNAQDFLQRAATATPFDIIFLDPPFSACAGDTADNNLLIQTLIDLTECRLLHEDTVVYVESPHDLDVLALPGSWQIDRHKRAGSVYYGLLRQCL